MLVPTRSYAPCFRQSISLGRLRRLSSAYAIQVQVGCFTQASDTIASSWVIVVIRSTMPRTPIIPDSEIVLSPFEAYLRVVVLRN